VGFYREGEDLWVLTSRDRTWWRNVRGGAQVTLLLRGKTSQALAEPELEAQAVEARLLRYIEQIPQAARPLGIRMVNKTPNVEDLQCVARDRLFVKVSLRPGRH
jgi:hypothetical protein